MITAEYDFYGQVETLQAFEGAGVVEKVLQGPGYNKVLVVDGGGSMNVAIFSKVAAASARQNGWKGVVIHGAIRDAKQVGETPIGCKAMGTNPNRGRATSGSKGSALNIFGMPINTGMWIYADKDGIALSDTELSVGGVSGMPAQGSSGLAVGAGYPLAGGTPGYGAQTTNGYQGGQTAYTSQSFGGSTSGNVMGAGGTRQELMVPTAPRRDILLQVATEAARTRAFTDSKATLMEHHYPRMVRRQKKAAEGLPVRLGQGSHQMLVFETAYLPLSMHHLFR
ncbi:hypothetical protein MHU86_22349 [Fragilaria crotonensis]|nr:hypothetical protein MHU86_22349 [Fragilaria crotonensis]